MPGFTNPLWLVGLIGIPILYYLYRRATRTRKNTAMAFSHVAFLKSALGEKKPSRRPQYLFLLSIIAIVLVLVGFANPHLPLDQTKDGVSVVLVIDDSGSMTATDYQPNRLEAAKQSAALLIQSLDPKDYAGVVIFESGATTAAYLSPDKDRVMEKTQAIQQKNGQTALGDGLALAVDMADSIPNQKKVVVLLSDGVGNAGVISPEDATEFAMQKKVQVFTVGLGSKSPVLLGSDPMGTPQYATLDEATLQSIAEKTGGAYYTSVDEQTLHQIYAGLNREIVREKEETSIQPFLFAALLPVLLAELYFRYGKRRIIP